MKSVKVLKAILFVVILLEAFATSWISSPSGTGKVKNKPLQKVTWSESGITLKPAEVKAKILETAVKVAAEGVVLLKNDNNALSLKATNGNYRVNVFGASSLDSEGSSLHPLLINARG